MKELDDLTVYALSERSQLIYFVEPGRRGRPRSHTRIAADVACLLARSWPDHQVERVSRAKDRLMIWRVKPVFGSRARAGHIEFTTNGDWEAEKELADAWAAAGLEAKESLEELRPLARAARLREALREHQLAETARAQKERRRAEAAAARRAKRGEARDDASPLAQAIFAASNGRDFVTERSEGSGWRERTRAYESSKSSALQRLLDPCTRMERLRESYKSDSDGLRDYCATLESVDGRSTVRVKFRAPPMSTLVERKELQADVPGAAKDAGAGPRRL